MALILMRPFDKNQAKDDMADDMSVDKANKTAG